MLKAPNPHGRPNSDVIVPWINGLDVTRRSRDMWIIDFGTETPCEIASRYEVPFEHVVSKVKPERDTNNRQAYREKWWIHVEARPALRGAISKLKRFIATVRVSKYRICAWFRTPTLPDSATFAFALADDSLFGILQCRIHEVWALRQGTQLETRPRYTPGSCFETFPFPEPRPEQQFAIVAAAKELDDLRSRWLNPPEWTKPEVLEFPGSVNGPWARYVAEPDACGIGTVRWPRLVPKDAESAASLKSRTLTNLYNKRPAWLDLAHNKLDAAVFAGYGWDPEISDDELLERLLKLNLSQAGKL